MTKIEIADWLHWFELYAVFAPMVIMLFGSYLAYDANRWRWARKAPKPERK